MSLTSQSPTLDEDAFVRQSFIDEVRTYLGVPWLHMGRTHNGIDCVGLIVESARACGLHDYTDEIYYTRKSIGQDLLKPFREHMNEIRLGKDRLTKLKQGDLLIMRDKYYPQHVAIIAERKGLPSIIHSSAVINKTVEQYVTDEIEMKSITAFRFRFFS